ncbi:MAG: hypothetical protein BWY71_01776 [Planctomycetes bacterium ADurb.Bin412]|nr:MAG: hypothetical protein BWY71_01776 [Planctomycetes bacterium ADurb.Bin412]
MPRKFRGKRFLSPGIQRPNLRDPRLQRPGLFRRHLFHRHLHRQNRKRKNHTSRGSTHFQGIFFLERQIIVTAFRLFPIISKPAFFQADAVDQDMIERITNRFRAVVQAMGQFYRKSISSVLRGTPEQCGYSVDRGRVIRHQMDLPSLIILRTRLHRPLCIYDRSHMLPALWRREGNPPAVQVRTAASITGNGRPQFPGFRTGKRNKRPGIHMLPFSIVMSLGHTIAVLPRVAWHGIG